MGMGISGGAKRATALVPIAVMIALATLTSAPAQAAVAKPTGLRAVNASTSSLVLKWKPVRRATSYLVEVATDPGFDDTVYGATTANTQATPTTVLPVSKLFWRVRASTSSGSSRWALSAFTPSRRSGPALIGPPSGSILQQPESPPVLTWQPVPGAERYEVEIDGVEHDWVDTETLVTESTSMVVDEPQPNGTYWWRVRAVLDNAVNTRDSAERSYTIGPLGHVTLNETDPEMEEVVLSWDPVPGAVAYEIRVSTDNEFNTVSITDQRVVSGTTYSPIKTYDNASYWWQVRAKNALGQAEEWPIYPERTGEFRRHWDAVPQLVYPNVPSPTGDLYFQWTPTELATRYELDVGTDPGFSSSTFFKTCTTTQTTYTPGFANVPGGVDRCLPPKSGTYYWRVQAIDGPTNVNSVFSRVGTFTHTAPVASTGTLGEVTGERLMLDGGGQACAASLDSGAVCDNVTATPVLDWDPVPGAVKYLVYLAHDRLFTNMVSGYGDAGVPDRLPRTSNTRLSLNQALPDTQAGQAYYWYVRACDAAGRCGLTPDEASNAFQKKSPPVELLQPADLAQLQDQVTFDWTDYLLTNSHTTDSSTGDHPGQAAQRYRLQVSRTPTFTSTDMVDQIEVDQTTYTAFTKTYPEGALWWRVQAIDGTGNGLTWSDVRSFTKASSPPTALSPTGGQTVSGVQPFRWKPLDYAKYYDLEVYRNNDRLASSANRALTATNIRQTAFASKNEFQSLGQDFVWRVRRSDFSGNKSVWSIWHSFRVTAPLPVLVSPGSGKIVPRARTLFTWRPSPRAAHYQWQLRRGTQIEASVTTYATAWAPNNALDKGKWTWRVISVDANGDTLRASSWRRFTAK